MKKLITILFMAIMLMAFSVQAADLPMAWDASAGATGYKVYVSVDNGATWDAGVDVGNVTTYTYLNVPEDGLILFRVSAYNTSGAEGIRYKRYLAYDGTAGPPPAPTGFGME